MRKSLKGNKRIRESIQTKILVLSLWPRVAILILLCPCSACGISMGFVAVYGTLQARTVEWVAISSSSKASSPARDWTRISQVSCIGDSLPRNHWESHYIWRSRTRYCTFKPSAHRAAPWKQPCVKVKDFHIS